MASLASPRPLVSVLALFGAWVAVAAPARAEPPYADQLTPGSLRGIGLDAGDPWTLGYWEYLPSNFESLADDELLPLVVFLPGIGEYDDDSSCPGDADVCAAEDCGGDGLCRNLTWGPQSLIRVGAWDEAARPFIVVSPQNDVATFSTTEWDLDELDAFFQFVIDNYPVDTRRMYLTGMSQGGRGTMQYVAEHPRRFTAATPLPGGIVQAAASCSFGDTALWWFHGEDDNDGNLGPGVFNPCAMVELAYIHAHPDEYMQYPECMEAMEQSRPVARFTMFDDVAHSAWIPSIDPIGAGFGASEWTADQGCGIAIDFREYTAALDDDGIYSWFQQLDRPDVSAPEDVEQPGDALELELTATVIDDDAVTFTWTQLSGPAATLADADQATVQISALEPEQVYVFDVLGVDADGQWDRDEVTVTVLEAPPPSTSSEEGSGTSGDTSGADTSEGSGSATAATTTSTSATTATDASGTVSGASGTVGTATDGEDSSGSSEDGTAGEDDPGGCSCDARERGGASWLVLLVVPALRRRRGLTSVR